MAAAGSLYSTNAGLSQPGDGGEMMKGGQGLANGAILRGRLRYDYHSGTVELGTVDLEEYLYQLRDQELILIVVLQQEGTDLPMICQRCGTPFGDDRCPRCRTKAGERA